MTFASRFPLRRLSCTKFLINLVILAQPSPKNKASCPSVYLSVAIYRVRVASFSREERQVTSVSATRNTRIINKNITRYATYRISRPPTVFFFPISFSFSSASSTIRSRKRAARPGISEIQFRSEGRAHAATLSHPLRPIHGETVENTTC